MDISPPVLQMWAMVTSPEESHSKDLFMCATLLTWAGMGPKFVLFCLQKAPTAQECDCNPECSSGTALTEGKDLCVSLHTQVAVASEDRQKF